LQPIRTTDTEPVEYTAEITAHIKILPVRQPHLFEKLSQKATELRLLGMTYRQIAKALKINKTTEMKACGLKAV
jgi:hypothetical protein